MKKLLGLILGLVLCGSVHSATNYSQISFDSGAVTPSNCSLPALFYNTNSLTTLTCVQPNPTILGTFQAGPVTSGLLASLPSVSGNIGVYVATDCATRACTAGGGLFKVLLLSDGTTWSPGGSGGSSTTATVLCAGTGTVTAQTCTASPTIASLTASLQVYWTPNVACTPGVVTLNVSGFGAKQITESDGSNITATSCTNITGKSTLLVYDGTRFRLGENPVLPTPIMYLNSLTPHSGPFGLTSNVLDLEASFSGDANTGGGIGSINLAVGGVLNNTNASAASVYMAGIYNGVTGVSSSTPFEFVGIETNVIVSGADGNYPASDSAVSGGFVASHESITIGGSDNIGLAMGTLVHPIFGSSGIVSWAVGVNSKYDMEQHCNNCPNYEASYFGVNGTLDNYYGLLVDGLADSGSHFTNYYGVYLQSIAGLYGSVTHPYAIVEEPGSGNNGFGVTVPTATLHLQAGTAAAGTAPLKINNGTLLTTPENGVFGEYDGSHYYATYGGTRYRIPLVVGTDYAAPIAGIATATNCASAASPSVCGSAAAGAIAFPTGVTSVALIVNSSAVTANSEIHVFSDDSLGARLGVTCNSTLATLVGGMAITARSAGTSFTVTYNGSITANPLCATFIIVN